MAYCGKCLHLDVCKTTDSCDGHVPRCKHFMDKDEHPKLKHGRWIKDGDVVVCSNCGEEHAWDEYRATYCEDCGAKMDGEDEGDK